MRPRRYPRIPHLGGGLAGSPDDGVLTEAERKHFLSESVVIEEKLDGANVCIRVDESGRPEVTGRSGGRSDRAGQLGRLRAWVFERAHRLAAGLPPEALLYGEWLYLTHSIHYDRLPDYLVVVDIRLASGSFLGRRGRESVCRQLELTPAPFVYEGRLGSQTALRKLHGRSVFGGEPAEGLVLRREVDGEVVARAKWVQPGFLRKTDEEWRMERRYNQLAGFPSPDRPEASEA